MILQEGFSAFKTICANFSVCISAIGHFFRTVSPQAGGNSSFEHNLTEATIGKQIIKAPFLPLGFGPPCEDAAFSSCKTLLAATNLPPEISGETEVRTQLPNF